MFRFVIACGALLALLLCGGAATAQEATSYTRFLIPIYVADTPGAYGSLWQVRTFVHYAGAEATVVSPPAFCFGMCPDQGILGPGWPAVPVQHLAGFPEPALLMHVEAAHANDVSFSSRIRDVSRSADSAGSEVPVIREDRMSSAPVYLLNVPVAPRFRNTLRVYALPDVSNPEVEVRFYRQPATEGPRLDLDIHLLRSQRLPLRRREMPGTVNVYPAIAEIANLEIFPELAGETTIWVEVVPVTPGLRVWAMMSVTNNASQEVTLVTPQNK